MGITGASAARRFCSTGNDWTGAAGLLLTLLMAKAMNHSVSNILFTKCGTPAIKQTQGDIKGSLEPVEASDVGIFMRYAEDVIIVPKLWSRHRARAGDRLAHGKAAGHAVGASPK